jgi:hypothetical protein
MFVDEDVAIEDVGSGDGHLEFILEIDGEDIVIVGVFSAHIYQLTKNYNYTLK